MALIRIYILLSSFFLGLSALAGPVCSAIFTHDFALDPYADLNHQGALDITLELDRNWMFRPKWSPAAKHILSEKTEMMPLATIRFMQNRISNNYSDNHTVIDNARAIRDGLLDPKVLPPIRVWRDQQGKVWTLDHRRLASMILSGKVDATPVVWAKPDEVQKQTFKGTTVSDGDNILLTIKKGPALLVERPYLRETYLTPENLTHLLTQMPAVKNAEALKLKIQDLRVTTLLPQSNWPQIRPTNAEPAVLTSAQKIVSNNNTAVAIDKILYSKNSLSNETSQLLNHESVLSLAQKIKSGSVSVSALPALKAWQDSVGRVWTSDNALLAALRLSGVLGTYKVHWLSREEMSQNETFVDSQTGGLTLLLELRDHQVGLVIQ